MLRTNVFYLIRDKYHYYVITELSSANVFNLDWSEGLLSGKKLNPYIHINGLVQYYPKYGHDV